MFESKTIIAQNNDVITWLFILIGVLLFALNTFNHERLKVTTVSFLLEKYTNLFYSSDKNKFIFTRLDVLIFFTINILTALIFISSIFPQNHSLLTISAVLSLFLVFDYCIKYGVSILFNYKEEQDYATYLKMIYANNISLWLLPFLLFYAYSPILKDFFKWSSIVLLLILFTLRYIFILSKYKNFIKQHLFYFILYICTLEIAPLLLFAKWIAKM
ncbi:MAG: DUF4271 domain-containing protein [Flavobacteriaceae bacterium]|nr:DUF4271 domain-containing protein [Flavobacteriaceae bacterium]